MKNILPFSILILALFFSCQQDNYLIGAWRMKDLSTIDSSINRSSLLTTFLIRHYSTTNFLSFSSDNSVKLETFDGKMVGSGTYKFDSDMKIITPAFPNDKIQTTYKINRQNFKTLKLSAHHDGETVNLTLKKKQTENKSRNLNPALSSHNSGLPHSGPFGQKINSRLLTRTTN